MTGTYTVVENLETGRFDVRTQCGLLASFLTRREADKFIVSCRKELDAVDSIPDEYMGT